VLLAVTIPSRERFGRGTFLSRREEVLGEFRSANDFKDNSMGNATRTAALHVLAEDCKRAESPMVRFEHALTPWIKHLVMPVFALANAGVAIGGETMSALTNRVGLGVICGLVLGKPIGIVTFSWFATRTKLAAMPAQASWRQILAVGMLAGIGFTMSLFIANLAFGDTPLLETAKVGILAASVASGVAGVIVLVKKWPEPL
jgi:Na+:H+ antiporter, NhaA family